MDEKGDNPSQGEVAFTLPLDSPQIDFENAGGKGARLAKLVQAGFPVPAGFIITTATYQALISANLLNESVPVPTPGGNPQEMSEAPADSSKDSSHFDLGLMPPEVRKSIVKAYREMGAITQGDENSVAVRSSATVEDGDEASFAGQGTTCLNVVGEDGLLSAIIDVWASLESARSAAYRARLNPDTPVPEMAVVVQKMVPADFSGILFTCDPLTGDPDKIIIEAVTGLGEALVSGQADPERWVLSRAGGDILGRAGTGDSSPSRDQIAELFHLGLAVEAHFSVPQDVEWVISGGQVFLLQARPVTAVGQIKTSPTRVPVPPGDDRWPAVDEHPPQPYDLWSQAVLGEVWPHPVSPLMWSGVPTVIGGSIRHSLRGLNSQAIASSQWAGRFYGHVYYNEGALVYLLSEELGLPASFVNAAVGSQRSADRGEQRGFRPLRFIRGLPFVIRMALTQLGTGRELEELFKKIDAWTATFSDERLESLDDRELWEEFLLWVDRFNQAISLQAEISNIGITAFALLEWLLDRWLDKKELAQSMITGLSGVYAAEMGLALWRIARVVGSAGLAGVVLETRPEEVIGRLCEEPAGAEILSKTENFLNDYGHRCPNEGEWLYPRWAEAPEQLWPLVAGYLRAGERVDPEQAEARQRSRQEGAVDWALSRLGPIRRGIFRQVLSRAQHGARLRDNGKHYYMKLALPIRRIDLEFGNRWATCGWLESPEDIFFLTIPDIQAVLASGDTAAAGLDLRYLVHTRRLAFEYWTDLNYTPALIGSDGQPLEEGADRPAPARNGKETVDLGEEPLGSSRVLRGIPASAGRARGVARIVSTPEQAMGLGPGDILVTRAADPGWTPVFTLVGGLVLEVGGQLSHAAIVARECGLPAVVNVPRATQEIQEGQPLLVDGTNGEVHLLGERVHLYGAKS